MFDLVTGASWCIVGWQSVVCPSPAGSAVGEVETCCIARVHGRRRCIYRCYLSFAADPLLQKDTADYTFIGRKVPEGSHDSASPRCVSQSLVQLAVPEVTWLSTVVHYPGSAVAAFSPGRRCKWKGKIGPRDDFPQVSSITASLRDAMLITGTEGSRTIPRRRSSEDTIDYASRALLVDASLQHPLQVFHLRGKHIHVTKIPNATGTATSHTVDRGYQNAQPLTEISPQRADPTRASDWHSHHERSQARKTTPGIGDQLFTPTT
ncbi:hypothetical protein C7212DRAFT_347479 [Tuber magnatum]|uniref:Uncharacterized protein n=1 Tax=Tuber magnatum TaxID=42249 RepID=A0A317SHV4_9PEZI|nr:hypothetical protein C7212DRAFT_347479 [Tuber magnatum]